MSAPLKVAVLLYDNVVLTDAMGPTDVFLHANRYTQKPGYDVYTVGSNSQNVLSENGTVTIVPQYAVSNAPEPDIVVIPGVVYGMNMDDPVIINWIKTMCQKNKTILSVCTGLYILAQTGLLSGKNATTHYLVINDIHKKYPEINLIKNVRHVADGNIITSGGITSGIDGALYLIGKNDGSIVEQQVSDVMVYNNNSAVPPYTVLPPYYLP